MDLGLAGKTALVTGGSKGIGRAAAAALAAEGVALTLIARSAGPLGEAAEAIRSTAQVPIRTIAADLSRQDELEQLAAAVPTPDILVNNAGAGYRLERWPLSITRPGAGRGTSRCSATSR